MRLDPLYTVTFTTPEAWSVEVTSDAGIEGRGFLLAEGRSAGRLSARYRAANFPRKRSDGALVPEFRGVLETDDGAVILFEWQGLAVLSDSGMRRLLGSLVHTTDAPRYRWLNDRVCQAMVYGHGMGTIVRCASCDNALIRVGRGPGRYLLDMRGVRYLQAEQA
jgi:Family of unknown function (DUF6510)/Protein of unknown function (DUF3237)